MGLQLVSKPAKHPFYYDKLNIRLYSAEELGWCVYHYPLLALDGLLSPSLTEWIGGELGLSEAAEALDAGKKSGESAENLLLVLLQCSGMYTQAEIRTFRDRLLVLSRQPKAVQLKETAKSFYDAGRFHEAAEKYEEAAKELFLMLRGAKTEEEACRINEEKADLFCDLACVRMRMFDEAGALAALDEAEVTGYCSRAQTYRYLINGTGNLGEETEKRLEEQKELLLVKALESPELKKLENMSDADDGSFFEEAERTVRIWKKEYRKTC